MRAWKKIVSFKNDVVSMTINSPFKHDIIRKKYLARIEKDFSTLLGFDVSVDLDCTAKLNDDDEEQNEEKKEIPIRKEDLVNNWGSTMPAYNFEYTFDNFIVGNSNKFAHAACTAVASNPARNYNPLFIYGPSGLGKTHLMSAIVNEIKRKNPAARVVYIKGDDFTNQMIEALSKQEMYKFHEKYRSCDILLIDDIQFIAGKTSTQEEFFHTFNALYEEHKQIILTSDRPPKEMVTLEERIRSRFEQGLIVDIHQPDYELRLAILKNKAESMNLKIDDEVLAYIAERLHSNIRQLEGIIKRISATHLLDGAIINMDMIRSLVPMFQQDTEPVGETAEKIIAAVAKRYSVTPSDILGTKRTKDIKDARNISMYILRQSTDLSLPAIGTMFSRDHSTVHSNITAVEKQLKTDAALQAEIENIKREIKR